MELPNPGLKHTGIMNFLKKYRLLIFWLIWGLLMSLMFGIIIGDYYTSFAILMGFGVFLGLVMQFVTSTRLRAAAGILCLLIALLIVWKPVVSFLQIATGQKISRSFLVDDIRQMAKILEQTHPDPYINGGGKIAFHRRMQDLIRTIPEDGLTKIAFYRHLSPMLAAVGDGHTGLWPNYELNYNSPGGIPFYFQAVDNCLYVAGVTDSAHRELLGSKLMAVENITTGDLLQRQGRIRGYDNEYQLLRYLGYDGSLWHREMLMHLIPEWQGDSIQVVLQIPSSGAEIDLSLPENKFGLHQLIIPETGFDLPSIEKSDYVYRFLDEKKKTVLLRIENMYTYRETFEMGIAHKGDMRKDLARDLYRRYNDRPAPVDYDEIVAGIPSATELCRTLLEEMKANRSENLIIDLRRNQGGNAFISTIFYYFLYGKEALISFRDRRSIFVKKYSPLFWQQYPAWHIDDINEHQPITLTEEDYDFSGYPPPGDTLTREESIRIIEDEAVMAATFWQEYQSEKYSGYYRPKNLYLLCSPLTNSSAYAFMYDHWAGGGKVVGIPSSQAGNNFGAWVGFKLTHSGLRGGISHLYITHFRNDPEMGRTFRPDYEMTYDDLKRMNFDPNAEVLFTLDLIKGRSGEEIYAQ